MEMSLNHLGGVYSVYTYASIILLCCVKVHMSCLQGLSELNGKVLEAFNALGFCTQGTRWKLHRENDDFP